MKKSLSILCIVALLIGMMIPASAADLTITVGSVSDVEPGAEVTLPVSISNNPGLIIALISLDYDSALTLKSATQVKEGMPTMTFLAGNNLTYDALEADYTDGKIANLTFTAPTEPGTYQVKAEFLLGGETCYTNDWYELKSFTSVPGTITVKGNSEHTAKWDVTGGKVYASATEWTDGDVTLTDGATGIKTTGDVYFYFFPDAGYTTTGMTIDGETVISDGTVASKKCTLTADKVFDIVFATASGTPTVSTPTVQATEYGATIFGQATNASSFGAYINNAQFAADGADGDGYFAIELSSKDGSKIFNAAKTYTAKLYADSVESAEVSVGITQ